MKSGRPIRPAKIMVAYSFWPQYKRHFSKWPVQNLSVVNCKVDFNATTLIASTTMHLTINVHCQSLIIHRRRTVCS